MTSPHIGNTGVNAEDLESSQLWCSGIVIHQICQDSSHWRAQGQLDHYLQTNQIPGIYGVDTRALTLRIRSQGVTRGIILPLSEKDQAQALLKELPPFEGRNFVPEVSTQKPYFWNNKRDLAHFRVVVVDFGIKWNSLRTLEDLNCEIEVIPAHFSSQKIIERKPHGVFLSNGPGDPMMAVDAIQTVRHLLGKVPIFGVCMGHQILALAAGGKTYKLKFGHRGGNQPVLEYATGRVEISSHNHGYSVDRSSLPPEVQITHINLNDETVEGIAIDSARAFSVQYHPEACPGPHDSMALFERFIHNMKRHVSEIP
jgi:carbamoyl-phosphate synthase small subunit